MRKSPPVVPIAQAGQVGAVDPRAVAIVVEVGPDLGADGLVQLGVVAGEHGPLGQVVQEAAALVTQARDMKFIIFRFIFVLCFGWFCVI